MRQAHVLVDLEYVVRGGAHGAIGLHGECVVHLPEVDRRGQEERAVGLEQVGLDALAAGVAAAARVHKRGAEPIARVRTRHVQVDVLLEVERSATAAAATTERVPYERLGEPLAAKVHGKRAIVRRNDRIGGILQVTIFECRQ